MSHDATRCEGGSGLKAMPFQGHRAWQYGIEVTKQGEEAVYLACVGLYTSCWLLHFNHGHWLLADWFCPLGGAGDSHNDHRCDLPCQQHVLLVQMCFFGIS